MKNQESTIFRVSISCIILGIFVAVVLNNINYNKDSSQLNYIGMVVETFGEVKIRYGESISWNRLKANGDLFSGSYLFTGENSEALFAFLDGSTLKLDANSLIFLDFMYNIDDVAKENDLKNSLKIDFVDGEVSFDLKESSPLKEIKTSDTSITFNAKDTMLKIRGGEKEEMQVSVLEGDVSLNRMNRKYSIKKGEVLNISNSGQGIEKESIEDSVMEQIKKTAQSLNKDGKEITYKRRTISAFISELLSSFKEVFF